MAERHVNGKTQNFSHEAYKAKISRIPIARSSQSGPLLQYTARIKFTEYFIKAKLALFTPDPVMVSLHADNKLTQCNGCLNLITMLTNTQPG